jgi:hypothetical protein
MLAKPKDRTAGKAPRRTWDMLGFLRGSGIRQDSRQAADPVNSRSFYRCANGTTNIYTNPISNSILDNCLAPVGIAHQRHYLLLTKLFM